MHCTLETNMAKAWKRVWRNGAEGMVDQLPKFSESVETLLNNRDSAKKEKRFEDADVIATELQQLKVCYIDEKKEWYTRDVTMKAPPLFSVRATKALTKAQLRNKRQAKKNRTKAKFGTHDKPAKKA
eukprot:m.208065 g.208065  ORF g.208065 m.208065 type:complete len:127 (-) comp33000_c0_seq1:886-1266(-)